MYVSRGVTETQYHIVMIMIMIIITYCLVYNGHLFKFIYLFLVCTNNECDSAGEASLLRLQ